MSVEPFTYFIMYNVSYILTYLYFICHLLAKHMVYFIYPTIKETSIFQITPTLIRPLSSKSNLLLHPLLYGHSHQSPTSYYTHSYTATLIKVQPLITPTLIRPLSSKSNLLSDHISEALNLLK